VPIRALSFDGDDTLWCFDTVFRAALVRSLEALRRARPEATCTLDDLLSAQADAVAGAQTRDLRVRRRLGYELALQRLGSPDPALAAQLMEQFVEHRSSLIELYPDVLPALSPLRARYPLGLVTNGNADTERCALAGMFSFRIYASEVGVDKPHPSLFQLACARAGCAPHELVHVGDSLPCDVAGARAAGAVAVWLDRACTPGPAPAEAHAVIHSLAELPALLDQIEACSRG
jgi:HAD superfamily hydrolase (TIGR01549 family)